MSGAGQLAHSGCPVLLPHHLTPGERRAELAARPSPLLGSAVLGVTVAYHALSTWSEPTAIRAICGRPACSSVSSSSLRPTRGCSDCSSATPVALVSSPRTSTTSAGRRGRLPLARQARPAIVTAIVAVGPCTCTGCTVRRTPVVLGAAFFRASFALQSLVPTPATPLLQ